MATTYAKINKKDGTYTVNIANSCAGLATNAQTAKGAKANEQGQVQKTDETERIKTDVKKAIAANLEAYKKVKNLNDEKKNILKTCLTNAANAMLNILGKSNIITNSGSDVYSDLLSEYINEPNKTDKKDAPIFMDFVYGYTNNKDNSDYSSQPIDLAAANTSDKVNNYNKNKAGLIALIAYVDYRTKELASAIPVSVSNSNRNINVQIVTTFIKSLDFSNIPANTEKELMCIFANLTWRVYEIVKGENRTKNCDFLLPIEKLIKNEEYTVEKCDKGKDKKYTKDKLIDTLKKDVVQIYSAAMVFSDSVKIPTSKVFIDVQTNNTEYTNYLKLIKFLESKKAEDLKAEDLKSYKDYILNQDKLITAHNDNKGFYC